MTAARATDTRRPVREYEPHLMGQSKHGWYDRPPTVGEVFRREVEEG